ncbi:hypothetical protein UVI_02059620 [Ustilaginoidea virens]|uniref:Uncharacterized protein n=1 Tax=Ustilaginoidea virens TaxID=1159556 RepID=A0A1B5L5K3_USTVR|nr:hypothetical protein UVI_02059620 [Ustilaginoidea virens]
MTAHTGEQPDCATLANNFQEIGDQIERFQNIPAFNNGALILERLDQLMHEITSFRQEVRSQFTAIDAKFEAMDAKFQAMDAKFQAIRILGELGEPVPKSLEEKRKRLALAFGLDSKLAIKTE